ncbi:MAG: transposase zinc-binding domain-containing protein [Bacteriovorax sp.]|nr:transposase zinc-binding domain-containing protein [Bacteriovorax sp.]
MYVPRTPYKTDLHALIRENYRQVFFDKENLGIHLPFHLEREFKKYLTCGIPAYGIARFHCLCCQKDKIVAFSCKGRTLCPSCTGRRTADTAKHLLEEVIPAVPIRQWVLSMPYTYRFLLATRAEFLRKSKALFHRTINGHYQKKAKAFNLLNPKVGAITVVQRFGGALNLNVHFHTKEENIINEDLSLAQLQAQSVQNRDEKFQLPIPLGKFCDPPFREFKGWRCCYNDGFSLHANVKILGNQREGLERLCRYILRGPIAKDRISYNDSGIVRLKLKTHIQMEHSLTIYHRSIY